MKTTRHGHVRAAAPLGSALREIVVVIPAHDERARLPRCLASVAEAANHVTVPVHVVVVLDACTDRSEDVVTGPVTVLRKSYRNVGMARAAGFASASAADPAIWLATTDADCVVPPQWLAAQVAHHGRAVQAVVGTVAVEWREHSPATRRIYDQLYRVGGVNHGHVHGANLGVRADAYWRVGGFRPLRVGEDQDLVERLAAAGSPIAWDAHNPVLTSDRRDSRAPGGFGDYVISLAEETEPSSAGGVS